MRPPRGSIGVSRVTLRLSASLAALCLCATAAAQPVDLPAWSTLTVPFSKAALCRAGGLSERIDSTRLLLNVIRILHGERIADARYTADSRGAILLQVDTLEQLRKLSAGARLQSLSLEALRRTPKQDHLALLTLFGLAFADSKGLQVVDASEREPAARRSALAASGFDLENLVARLNAGDTIPLALPREPMPLPLPVAVWRDAVFRRDVDEDGLLAAILTDRTAALVYYGLASLDGPTLEHLAKNRALLSTIARNYPGAFSGCGRSIRLGGGRVQVPGGFEAEPLWEALVGTRPSDIQAFVTKLLGRDAGRLAYFYDTLAHLDPARLRFALGLATSDPVRRLARWRALYKVFAGVDPSWILELRPFSRPQADGGLLLAETRVTDQGRLAPPASAALWATAFTATDLPLDDEDHSAPTAAQGEADAAQIAEMVLVPDPVARQARFGALLFAERVFGATDASAVGPLLVTLRGFLRFEALDLTFERMGVTDPQVYARATRQAERLSRIGNRRRIAVALSQLQGLLALLDRFVVCGVIDGAQATRLIDSLVGVPVPVEAGYDGRIAAWIEQELLPCLKERLPWSTAEGAEDLVLEGLAGLRPAGDGAAIRWEDGDYRVDPSSADLDRLLRVRRKQEGNRLDDALALARIVTGIRTAAAGGSAAGGRAGTGTRAEAAKEEARRLGAQLAELAGKLRPAGYAAPDGARAPDLADTVAEAGQRLADAREADDLRKIVSPSSHLPTLADEILGDVLRSLAYAVSLGDPDSNLLLGTDVAGDHDFGLFAPQGERTPGAWRLPRQVLGLDTPWHVAGSLVALDVPLASTWLRRISTDQPLQSPRLNEADGQGFAHTAAIVRPRDFKDADRDRLVACVNQGRARVRAASMPAGIAELAAAAGMSEWRRNALAWAAAREPDRAEDLLALSELAWIGRAGDAAPFPDAWGVSTMALDGSLCPRFPSAQPMETYALRSPAGLLPTRVADVALRLAELTAELKLPAAIAALVLPGIIQDLLETVMPAHSDDWVAVAEAAREIARDRFEDHVSALTIAGGPLVPSGQ